MLAAYTATGVAAVESAEILPVGLFSTEGLSGWEEKIFKGKTLYRLVKEGESTVLEAESSGSASAMIRRQPVDLLATPYLNWRWKVTGALSGLNEREREGDDYAARLYVVFATGNFPWQRGALTYVWSGSESEGSSWANAYTGKVRMVAVSSGIEGSGEWIGYKRHVRADIERLFGQPITELKAVALMSDSDDSGRQSRALYGDIYFSSH